MKIQLNDTTAAVISSEIVRARRKAGSPAMGMVLTMVVVTDQDGFAKAMDASLDAGREHPARILVVVTGTGGKPGLDAELRISEGTPGETIILRMSGPLAQHPDSVVLPLLLPDTPVVVWWPGKSPERPGEDPIGQLADRRLTDAMGFPNPLGALEIRAANHLPGDTDLTWTRLTPWRALLAAALDQYPATISAAVVEAARDNAPANLMAAWLETRLRLPVRRENSRGPGITAVRLTTAAGDLALVRDDGLTAFYYVPGQPRRRVALKRRSLNELVTEELRRMDSDEIFEQACAMLLVRARRDPRGNAKRRSGTRSAKKTAPKKSASGKSARSASAKPAGHSASRPAKRSVAKRTAKATQPRRPRGSDNKQSGRRSGADGPQGDAS